MTFEHVALLCFLVLIVFPFLAWYFAGENIVRRAAVWIGNKIADLGGGGPRL